ncbi:MAG: amidohydrolase [Clostridia bacterium]
MSSILIKNGFLVDMVKKQDMVKEKDILIVGGKIIKIENKLDDKADITIDAKGCSVMPGFVNSHTHSAMSIFRGYADDSQLMDWLQNKIWPVEDKLTKEEIYFSTYLGCIEMIKSGTTTFNDMYFMMDSVAKAVEDCKMRAFLGRCIMSVKNRKDIRVKEAIKLYNDFNCKCNDKIKVNISAHAPYTCDKKSLLLCKDLCEKLNVALHIHLDETKSEHENILKQEGMSPTKYLDSLGLFDIPTILAHGVWLEDSDINILKSKNTSIVHNPISNAKLASGIAPITKYIKNGINVCLGTDGAGSTNTLDMFEEMKVCNYLQKISILDSSCIDAYQALEMATINGAKALGIEKEIGTIEIGKKADIIIVDMKKAHLTPFNNIYSNLVYACNGSDVVYTIVDGEILMENRKLNFIDEKNIIDKCQMIAKKYFK